MKIESEIIEFHPACQFEKLALTDLQKQYLADLRAQNSIQSMTEKYLANGWLVNFHLLFELMQMLATHHWILNPSINAYFQNLQTRPIAAASANSPVATKARDATSASANKANSYSTSLTVRAQTSRPTGTYSEDALLQLPFFRSLNLELARFLLKQRFVNRYPAESSVCRTGEASRELYVLLKGELGVFTRAATFKQFVAVLPESSVFGEAGFLLGEKRTADVVALKSSEVLVVPYQAEILDRFLNKEKAQSLQQRFWVQHALLHSEFFKKTPADCLDALTFSGKLHSLDDQQILFRQGDAGHSAYIVIQGSLTVSQDGGVINTLAQGAFLGEISLMINDGRRTATVTAQRNTKVLEISRRQFYLLLSRNLYLAQQFQLLADQRLKLDAARLRKA